MQPIPLILFAFESTLTLSIRPYSLFCTRPVQYLPSLPNIHFRPTFLSAYTKHQLITCYHNHSPTPLTKPSHLSIHRSHRLPPSVFPLAITGLEIFESLLPKLFHHPRICSFQAVLSPKCFLWRSTFSEEVLPAIEALPSQNLKSLITRTQRCLRRRISRYTH